MKDLLKQEQKALAYFHEAHARLNHLVEAIGKEMDDRGSNITVNDTMIQRLQAEQKEHQKAIGSLNDYRSSVKLKMAKIEEFTTSSAEV